MTKEEEILNYLSKNVFDPILDSPHASGKIKTGVRYTIMRLKERDAKGMLSYFWAAMQGTERSIGFGKLIEREGFKNFEAIFKEFREKFDDTWLRSRK